MALAGSMLLAGASKADVLYDNGPANGQVDAWTINSGFAVANAFTLGSAAQVTGLNFTVWNSGSDVTSAIDWSIVTSPTLGTTLASGTASVSQVFAYTNTFGYSVNADSIAIPAVALVAGTYWIELQNAVVTGGDQVYWDINGGPSQVWENSLGYNPDPATYGVNGSSSDTFQIIGPTSAPEPASALLFGLPLAAIAALRRPCGMTWFRIAEEPAHERRRRHRRHPWLARPYLLRPDHHP
jgi:hypothetical protein